jgi:hypothetical protein
MSKYHGVVNILSDTRFGETSPSDVRLIVASYFTEVELETRHHEQKSIGNRLVPFENKGTCWSVVAYHVEESTHLFPSSPPFPTLPSPFTREFVLFCSGIGIVRGQHESKWPIEVCPSKTVELSPEHSTAKDELIVDGDKSPINESAFRLQRDQYARKCNVCETRFTRIRSNTSRFMDCRFGDQEYYEHLSYYACRDSCDFGPCEFDVCRTCYSQNKSAFDINHSLRLIDGDTKEVGSPTKLSAGLRRPPAGLRRPPAGLRRPPLIGHGNGNWIGFMYSVPDIRNGRAIQWFVDCNSESPTYLYVAQINVGRTVSEPSDVEICGPMSGFEQEMIVKLKSMDLWHLRDDYPYELRR